ncbi:MAG: RNA polymerase factor sigma-54 [Gammaproteobacteria bacterium]|nr:RNA polymerase factor sigma-54 [Gammaproteobacteria bacterium]
MSNKMLLTTRLDQRLSMSQQLTQAITLLQYNTLDLQQLVQQYIETNPLIEVDEPEESEEPDGDAELLAGESDEQYYLSNYSADYSRSHEYTGDEDDSSLENHATPKSLRDYLIEQTLLCKFSLLEQVVAVAIIDAIDDDGRLTMSMEDIRATISEPAIPEMAILEFVLKKIQTFDPLGIAAKDMQECLLIQLNCMENKDIHWQVAYSIISHHFELVAVKNSKKIIQKLGLTHEAYADAMALIRSLNPNPGREFSASVDIKAEPELYIKKIKNKWQVFRSDSILNHVKINKQYQNLLRQSKKHASYDVLNKELQEAQWLLRGLKRRNETLLIVASYIVETQHDFLEKGHAFMLPMNMAEVALAVNLHESTISRITTGKYISTPKGIFELKYFFPSQVLTKTGEGCSDTAVKSHIKDIIASEVNGHIHSDEEMAVILKNKGIHIARRTVAKYREAMKIEPSYQRAHAFFHETQLRQGSKVVKEEDKEDCLSA